MSNVTIVHEVDPKQKLIADLGDLSGIELFNNQILLATYIRPTKTKLGGRDFYMTDKTVDEDRYQSKVGLLVRSGPKAFEPNDEGWFSGETFQLHDWLIHRPADGWSMTVNGVLCRLLIDTQVKMRIPNPDQVY